MLEDIIDILQKQPMSSGRLYMNLRLRRKCSIQALLDITTHLMRTGVLVSDRHGDLHVVNNRFSPQITTESEDAHGA